MSSFSATMLVLVCIVIAITVGILSLVLIREFIFWYWRSKGVLKQPEDILNQYHETALIIRKSIAGLKAAELAAKNSAPTQTPIQP